MTAVSATVVSCVGWIASSARSSVATSSTIDDIHVRLHPRHCRGARRGRPRGAARRSARAGAPRRRSTASSGHGTVTNPPLSAPRRTAGQLGDLPRSTSTRSPGSSPRDRRSAAHRPAAAERSSNVRLSMTPSASTNLSAVRSGPSASASTTSRVKLNRSGASGTTASSDGPATCRRRTSLPIALGSPRAPGEDVDHGRAFRPAIRRVLDVPGQDVPLHRPELVRDAVDHEGLHPAQHDPELLVRMAVRRDRGAGVELDQVDHRVLAEERAALDALDETERRDVVEADELRPHARDYRTGRPLGGIARDRESLSSRRWPPSRPISCASRPTSTAPGSTPTPARPSLSSTPRRARRSPTSRAWVPPRRAARSRLRSGRCPPGSTGSAKDRARILRRLADLMMERADDLAALLVREQGKPLFEAKARDRLRRLVLRVVRRGGEAPRRAA